MYLVVKKDFIICKAKNVKQAKCIIKTEQARSAKHGYNTTTYEYGKILFDKVVDKHCGWFRRETKVQFAKNRVVTYVGKLFRKDAC